MDNKQAIQEFADITGFSTRKSQNFLRKFNYDFEIALDSALSSYETSSKKALIPIFDKYKEFDDQIGIDGTIQYIKDLDLQLEDPVVLALAKQLDAEEMGIFSRTGFINGWSKLKVSSISDMKNAVKDMKNRMETDVEYFESIYKFTFTFNLNSGQRLLAIDYWKLLLPNIFELLDDWIKFIETEYQKNISKDTWNMILEFAKYQNNDKQLEEYDEEGAWPSVIDEFVHYIKEGRGS